ncbi:MAG: TIGR03985 family CRISPR-associated protein [Kamptonema sp. SIO4C4]|nr:TIGR03985 family CRISPR-associated protein [Kamptonema sp. SIO4C4]
MFANRLNPPPTIEFLKQLAQGSLRQKQTFQRAIRLWVELRSLYAEEALSLHEPFTFAEWRDNFVSPSHPRGDLIPDIHDPACPCAKTAIEWLFPETQQLDPRWQKALKQQENFDDEVLAEYLKMRPFAVTRRSLQGDLHRLSQLGWLKRDRNRYRCIDSPPPEANLGMEVSPTHSLPLLNPNLEDVAKTLGEPLGGHPRCFLYVDYAVQPDQQDRLENWQTQLKDVWQQTPIPPVQLVYEPANQQFEVVVYPVCLYYVRRSLYLCAYGETPTGQAGWYNYRLEHIVSMNVRSPQMTNLPEILSQGYQQDNLPTPNWIEQELDNAWGFDFYAPKKLLLVRFEREFHDQYIQGTRCHNTFEQVEREEARSLILQHATPEQQKQLLQLLEKHSPEDTYYRAWYREGDSSVLERLRTWRPCGEILLPVPLREQMREEVAQEAKLYQ